MKKIVSPTTDELKKRRRNARLSTMYKINKQLMKVYATQLKPPARASRHNHFRTFQLPSTVIGQQRDANVKRSKDPATEGEESPLKGDYPLQGKAWPPPHTN